MCAAPPPHSPPWRPLRRVVFEGAGRRLGARFRLCAARHAGPARRQSVATGSAGAQLPFFLLSGALLQAMETRGATTASWHAAKRTRNATAAQSNQIAFSSSLCGLRSLTVLPFGRARAWSFSFIFVPFARGPQVGDRVRCRSSGLETWLRGEVQSFSPVDQPIVAASGWAAGRGQVSAVLVVSRLINLGFEPCERAKAPIAHPQLL